MGFPLLDPIAALIVGLMVGRMGWSFGWDALHDLMDRGLDEAEVQAIRDTLLATPGVAGVHDVRTRKMGDMVMADAHIEVDANLTVEAGHNIAVAARLAVLQRHRVLNLMTHVDPAKRPDADHNHLPPWRISRELRLSAASGCACWSAACRCRQWPVRSARTPRG